MFIGPNSSSVSASSLSVPSSFQPHQTAEIRDDFPCFRGLMNLKFHEEETDDEETETDEEPRSQWTPVISLNIFWVISHVCLSLTIAEGEEEEHSAILGFVPFVSTARGSKRLRSFHSICFASTHLFAFIKDRQRHEVTLFLIRRKKHAGDASRGSRCSDFRVSLSSSPSLFCGFSSSCGMGVQMRWGHSCGAVRCGVCKSELKWDVWCVAARVR